MRTDGISSLEIVAWLFLEYGGLVHGRGRRLCMNSHWFRARSGVTGTPLLTCRLHRGLIAPGEHLVSRCPGSTEDLVRQRGWAPEAG